MGLRWPAYVAMHKCENGIAERPPCGFGPHGTIAFSGQACNNSLSSTTGVAWGMGAWWVGRCVEKEEASCLVVVGTLGTPGVLLGFCRDARDAVGTL